MNLVKTTVIACGLSALLAYPVIAQSLAADAKARKGMQTTSIQSGMSDDEDSSPKLRTPGAKLGRKSIKGAKKPRRQPQDKETLDEFPTSNTPISDKRH
ncbi:hypothetical protein AOQ73_24290 [Bradyrhizobium pachyrhizi]|uniref:Uncharacterized protein n=1 Tax=Bradyrhizobium brasilense TaxID=1419277 RepID=A0A1G7M3V3_9BRAD|nr:MULTISPECIES: hypothetical protein [Bradyrhizobium]KRP93728.1 hypothetical protein AOQ73_24290 [Bradyrhizobium pachyrhizi]SDF56296.1 hypothetical protein SAMN05216337_106110 [Bradyrhizobium brasilense]